MNVAPPTPAAAAAALLGPPPIEGPTTRDAGLGGRLNVTAVAGDGRLDVRVATPSGPALDSAVELAATFADGVDAELHPRPCGPGCFTQSLALPRGASEIEIAASAPGWQGGTYRATLYWPPAPKVPERLERLVDRMRAVPRLTLVETVSSGPGSGGAPYAATLSGAELIASEPYAGGSVSEVRALPGAHDALRVHIAGSEILYTLWLDEAGRIARARIVTPGHEIERHLRYPSAP